MRVATSRGALLLLAAALSWPTPARAQPGSAATSPAPAKPQTAEPAAAEPEPGEAERGEPEEPAATEPPTPEPPPSGSATSAAPEPQAPEPQAPAATESGDHPLVRLQANDPRAVLEKRPHELERRSDLAGVDGWQAVCVAPCQARIDRRDRLRVGGSGLAPMDIYLPEGAGPFEVAADPGSSAYADAGFAMVLTGGLMIVAGGSGTLILLTTGATKNSEPDSFADIMLHASITTLALGGVLLAISVPMRFAGDGSYTLTPSGDPAPGGSAWLTPHLPLGAGVSLVPGGLVF